MLFNIDITYANNQKIIVLQPAKQLTDDEYNKIKKNMEQMGTHWRERFHGFTIPLSSFKQIHNTDEKEKLGFYPTPSTLAEKMVNKLTIKSINDIKVLEPSAGNGALLDALSKKLNTKLFNHVAVEVNEGSYNILKDKSYNVVRQTFEEFCNENKSQKFTHIIMNPPFNNQNDIKHVRLAYEKLEEHGELIAIISENSLFYDTEETRQFNEWLDTINYSIESIEEGSFAESGTMIDTVMLKITKE